ncbi:ProQ/FINO family protein [uncultured Halomonas sp.]|uniref:ProQ/FINO family protein n=1 Tax=uncultured Halomonas sp. TaxID=173971 RepID=UPI00262F6068|nr:ProQ/FINO family protein [uncultured Halomonas sp.]
MIEERSIRLLDALEGRTDTLLGLLQRERNARLSLEQRLAELEAASTVAAHPDTQADTDVGARFIERSAEAADAAKSPMCRTTDKSGSYNAVATTGDVGARLVGRSAECTDAPSPQALLAEWYQRYPGAFFKGHTRPLQVGIHEALAEQEPWPEKLVRRALACYVNLPRYLKAVREGAERIDLDGKPAGRVDAKAAEHARKKLERLQAEGRGKGRAAPAQPRRADGKGKPAGGGKFRAASKEGRASKSAGIADGGGKSRSRLLLSDEASSAAGDIPRPATLEEKLAALVAKHQGR